MPAGLSVSYNVKQQFFSHALTTNVLILQLITYVL